MCTHSVETPSLYASVCKKLLNPNPPPLSAYVIYRWPLLYLYNINVVKIFSGISVNRNQVDKRDPVYLSERPKKVHSWNKNGLCWSEKCFWPIRSNSLSGKFNQVNIIDIRLLLLIHVSTLCNRSLWFWAKQSFKVSWIKVFWMNWKLLPTHFVYLSLYRIPSPCLNNCCYGTNKYSTVYWWSIQICI